MLDTTTQSDLENLLGMLDEGWSAYAKYTRNMFGQTELARPEIRHGVGGCIWKRMNDMFDQQSICGGMPRQHRMRNILYALGFQINTDLFEWNDQQTSVDAIKSRIKEALNNG